MKYSAHLTRLASMDGWRAICIILVLGCHSRFTFDFPKSADSFFYWMFDGPLGVRCFFVISGFLITWLMILENDRSGRVSLRHFYARRALRILPVYFVFILVLIGLQIFTPYNPTLGEWIGNLTFTRNFIVGGTVASGHLWSLSVEEQFYLLWPSIFIWCSAKSTRALLCLVGLPIFIAPICRALTIMVWSEQHCPAFLIKYYPAIVSIFRPFLPFNSTFNYFDSLAIGCVCAILFARKRTVIETYLKMHAMTAWIVGLTLILIPYVLEHLGWFGVIIWPLGYTFESFGFAILLLQSIVSPQSGFYRALNWSWFCQIGVVSYSIYIWQELFCVKPQTYGLGNVWWMSFSGWLIPVFIIAFISYYGFERPLVKLRSHLREV